MTYNKEVNFMSVRLEEKDSFEVFGIEKIFPADEAPKISEFWKEVQDSGAAAKLAKAGGGSVEDAVGVHFLNAISGYTDGADFPYLISAFKEPDSDVTGYKVVAVPKTIWAVFTSAETAAPTEQVPVLFNEAYNEWLPSSGYERAKGPDLEVYFTAESGLKVVEAHIPVKKA
jgi:AraC family transcriptional regulator